MSINNSAQALGCRLQVFITNRKANEYLKLKSALDIHCQIARTTVRQQQTIINQTLLLGIGILCHYLKAMALRIILAKPEMIQTPYTPHKTHVNLCFQIDERYSNYQKQSLKFKTYTPHTAC